MDSINLREKLAPKLISHNNQTNPQKNSYPTKKISKTNPMDLVISKEMLRNKAHPNHHKMQMLINQKKIKLTRRQTQTQIK